MQEMNIFVLEKKKKKMVKNIKEKMNKETITENAETLAAVHTHTHTQGIVF